MNTTPNNDPNSEMNESEFWENELNAMAADDYDRQWEFDSMIMQEGIDYKIGSISSKYNTESPNMAEEQENSDTKSTLRLLEQTQKEVNEIHSALFTPLESKEKDIESQLTASILAKSASNRKNKRS